MFSINPTTELTPDLLFKMMERFSVEVRPRLQNWKNYFEGQQAICNKSYNDASKPCNKVITNYCADIVSSYNGYIASPGYISYTSNNDISEIMDCLRYNDYQDEDSDFLNDALIYGVANELMYNYFDTLRGICLSGNYRLNKRGTVSHYIHYDNQFLLRNTNRKKQVRAR